MSGESIRRALISVWDKTGLIELARALDEMGVALVSSGGTAKALREAGLEVTDVSEFTGSPEIFGGRVKTLHPKVHGGILARPEDLARPEELERLGIQPIDLVVVNLYPFEDAVGREGTSHDQAVEMIDIGGVALLRAAAKNHARVTVIADPRHYDEVLAEMRESGGRISSETRVRLAMRAYERTAAYDASIFGWLQRTRKASGPDEAGLREFVPLGLQKVQDLRYGENPHQAGAMYRLPGMTGGVVGARVLGGKEISFNNILDLTAASRVVADFDDPTCAVIKHATPCGAATGGSATEAFRKAHACDPVSAFGSIIALNRPLDRDTAAAMVEEAAFVEAIFVPEVEEDALEAIAGAKWGKSVRILVGEPAAGGPEVREVSGGFLLQQAEPARPEERVVSQRPPTDAEWADLRFAWRVVRHARSNAILLARGGATVGIGAGQVSRVDAVELAVKKAGDRAKGSVLASDGFFPFPDGLEAAAAGGVTAAIHPGGSRRDGQVIEAADRLGVALVTTGVRHFLH